MKPSASPVTRHFLPAWLALSSSLLILGLTVTLLIWKDYRKTDADARELLQLQAKNVGNELERRLKSINAALSGLRASVPFWATQGNGPALAYRHLTSVADALEGVRTLTVFDAGGTLVASNRPEFIGRNFADRSYFQSAMQGRNPDALYLSPPFKTALGVYSMLLVKSMRGPDGRFAGAVSAALEPDDFRSLLEGVRNQPDSVAGIVHGSGVVLLFTPDASSAPGVDAAPRERLATLYTVQPPALAMDHALLVSVSRNRDLVFLPWRQKAYLLAGIFLVLVLISTLGLFFYQRRQRTFDRETRRALLLMQSFIDHLPGLAYVKDGDSRVLIANQAFQRMGFDPALLIGKTSQEVLPGAMSDKINRDDQRVLLSGKAEVIPDEYAGRHYESRRFVIDEETGRRLLGGITVDVTRRQRSIQRVEALLAIHDVGGNLPEKEFLRQGLVLAERLTSSEIAFLHFVNDDQDSMELVTWTPNALTGCTAVHEAHYPISQAGIWADCFRQKKAVVFNDYPAYHAKKGLPAGHAPLVRLISVPVIEDGLVRLILGVGNKRTDYDDFDIETMQLMGNDVWRIVRRMRVEVLLQQRLAEFSALNKKLADAQGQLLQSEKMSAIGQLAAGVAHEINNPIGFVLSNFGTLAEYVDDLLAIDRAYGEIEAQWESCLPPAFARVQAIKRACDHDYLVGDLRQLLRESGEGLQRVNTIVQDLKNFSRVGETGWLWADLLAGLESTLNIVRNEIKYKVEVVRELVELPQVRCIPSQINQVFMNLLVNAGQAIETQGQITLRCGRDGDFIWIEVQDDGCGIAPEHVARVFEPFYTSKPVGKGTGLGLSLAWGIVQRHQGTIEVTSVPGQGATFRVRLPIAGPIVITERAPPL